MWPFRKNEIRENEQPQVQPYIDKPTDACTEVNQGVGLLNKLLNLKGYDALSQSPFFAAVNLISSSVGQMHWEVKSKTDEEIPSNMYANIKDFGLLTQFMLVKNIIKDAILSGNGFAYIHRDKSGKPISLEYLPTSEISIRYNPITKILYYMIPNKNNMLVEPINVIHVLMHSKNGVEGHSLLSFATNTIKLSGNAEKAASEFFSNGMNVHGILSTDSPRLTKDQREAIRSAWNESQIGNGTGIAVLEGGMNFQAISSNSKDAQLLETRLFNVQEVSRWFNISPVLLGDLSKTSYNNLEQSQLQFVTNTLAPFVVELEQELNRKLILPKDQDKYYIDVIEEDIIKQDKQSQVNYLSTLVDKGIITRNEARKQLGYAPVEGADELMISYSDPNQNKINQEDKNNENIEDEEES